MKVTVNACRKKRVKVDVTAVTSRRDVVRIPVKAASPAPEEPQIKMRKPHVSPSEDQLDLSVCDVDGDGTVGMLDALTVLRMAMGLVE